MLTPEYWAQKFKLHKTSPKFASQVREIQDEARKELKEEIVRLKNDLKKAQNEWAILYKQSKGY